MITIIKRVLNGKQPILDHLWPPARLDKLRYGRWAVPLGIAMVILFTPFTLHLLPLYADDSGVDFEAVDDLSVSGTGGNKNDADLEVKGVSSFAKDVFVESGILAGPYGGIGRYENLLLQSENFSTSWTSANATLALNVLGPNGSINGATTLTVATSSPGYVTQVVTTTVTFPYTLSVWAKSGTATNLTLELTANGTGATTDTSSFTLTSNWQRFSLTKSTGAGTSPTNITATIKTTGSVGQTIFIWGAQLEQASTPGVYAKTASIAITASRGVVSTGDFLMPSLKLSGGQITDTSGTVTVGSNLASTGNLQVTGAGPHYISAGNVGIGTTNPSQGKMQIYRTDTIGGVGGTLTNAALAISNAAGDGFYIDENEIHQSGDNFNLYIDTAGTMFNFQDDAGSIAVFKDGGNVGIGTTGPGYKLDVTGTGRFTDAVAMDSSLTVTGNISSPAAGGSEKFGLGANATGGTGGENLAVGNSASATGGRATAVGYVANASGYRGTAIGNESLASGTQSTSIGKSSTASGNNSIALGWVANADQANILVAGGDGVPISNVYFGEGRVNATPSDYTINGTGGSGTNIAGGALQLAGGQGTGSGAGGSIKFLTSPAGSVGTSLNALSERMRITSDGNVGIGTAAPSQALELGPSKWLSFEGATDDAYETIIQVTDPTTADKTITFPNASGTLAVSASAPLNLSALGALTITDAQANGSTKGAAAFTAVDFNDASGVISIDYTTAQSASSSTKGFLTSADWTIFNNKQAAITAGATTDYWRGDKTWRTLDKSAVGLGNVDNIQQMPASYLDTTTTLGTSDIKVPTQNAVKTYVDANIAGLSWKEAVLDLIEDNTIAPQTPETNGDRYVLSKTGGAPHANWDGAAAGDIVQFNGTTWVKRTPIDGDAVFVEDVDTGYVYTGTAWTPFTGATAYTWGNGLANTSGITVDVQVGNGIQISNDAVAHADTSSQTSVDNSDSLFIQDVSLDEFGHVTTLASVDLDTRYFTETEASANFVNVSGDTMTGSLTINNNNGIDNENLAIIGDADDLDNLIVYGNVGIGTTGPNSKLELGSGQIAVPLGSVGSPSYSFTGDLNTGLFSQAADRLNIVAGGATAFLVSGEWVQEFVTHYQAGGSVTAPGYAIYGDANTGIYSSVADEIGIAAGGVSVLYANGGNVGIGTTNPSAKLQISGNPANIKFFNTTSNDWAEITETNNGHLTIIPQTYRHLIVNTTENDEYLVDFQAAGASKVVIDYQGSVGINTTSPEAKLDVEGTMQVTTAGDTGIAHDLVLTNVTSSAVKSYGPLTIQSGGSNDNFNLVLKGTGTGKVIVDDDFTATGNIELGDAVADTVSIHGTVIGASPALFVNQSSTDDIVVVQDGGSDVFKILDGGNSYFTGNLGIGTTAPTAPLHIRGPGTNNQIFIISEGSNGTDSVKLGTGNSGDGTLTLLSSGGDNRVLLQGYGNSYFTGGNVGIGLTGPGEKLSVAGNVMIGDATWAGGTTTGGLAIQGSVGIGTKTPVSKLEVAGDITVTGGGAFVSASELRGISLRAMGGDFIFSSNTTSGWQFRTAGNAASEVMRISSGGNIGIGTTTPSQKLEVAGNIITNTANSFLGFRGNPDSAYYAGIANFSNQLILKGEDEGALTRSVVIGKYSAKDYDHGILNNPALFIHSIINPDTDNTQWIGLTHDTGDGTISTGKGDLILSPATGYVGIGTTNPQYVLDVNGTSRITGNLNFDGGAPTIYTVWDDMVLNVNSDSAGGGGRYAFQYAGTEWLTIRSTGNIGIGTTGPSQKLELFNGSGNAIAQLTGSGSGNYPILRLARSGSDYWDIGKDAVSNGIDIRYYSGSYSNKMTILNTGNVGIGTTNPISLFHAVGGNVGISSNQGFGTELVTNNGNWTGDFDLQTDIDTWTDNYGNGTEALNSGGMKVTIVGAGSAAMEYRTITVEAGVLYYYTMTILSGGTTNGHLMIGTGPVNSSYANYDGVPAGTYAGTFTPSGASVTITLKVNSTVDGASTIFDNISLRKANVASSYALQVASNLTTDLFKVGDNAITVPYTGNVGIGTTAPSAKLEVSGGDLKVSGSIYQGGTVLSSSYIQLQGETPGTQQTGNLNISGVGIFQGNVGIGTTSPAYELDVNGNTYLGGGLYLGGYVYAKPSAWTSIVDSGGNHAIVFSSVGSRDILFRKAFRFPDDIPLHFGGDENGAIASDMSLGYDSSSDTFRIAAGENLTATPKFVINTSGNVGIGTTGPTQKLFIQDTTAQTWIKNTSSTGLSALVTINDTAGSFNQFITFGSAYAGTRKGVTAAGLNEFSSQGNLWLGTESNNNLYLGTNSLVRGVIDNTGNVGIGTTSPKAPLQVGAYTMINNPGAPTYSQFIHNAYWDAVAVSWKYLNTDTINALQLKDDFIFYTAPSGTAGTNAALLEKMRITNAGNVGIGTTNPGTNKLYVNGPLYVNGTINTGATTAFNDITVGGGYNSGGDGGLTIDSAGNLKLDGNIWVKGTTYQTNYEQLYIENNNILLNVIEPATDEDAYIAVMSSGTKAAPGYTGLLKWNATPDRWDFGTSGTTNNLYVSGNVGIGTMAPGVKFEVNGGALAAGPIAQFTGTGNQIWTDFKQTGATAATFRIYPYNDGNIFIQHNQPIKFADLGSVTPRVTIDTSGNITNIGTLTVSGAGNSSIAGNVGIGTTNPAANLEVYGSGTPEIRIHAPTGGAESPFLSFYTNVASLRGKISVDSSSRMVFSVPGDIMRIANRGLSFGNDYTTSAAPTDGMIIQGNVGIGTTNPQSKLEVYSNNSIATARIRSWGDSLGAELLLDAYGGADSWIRFKTLDNQDRYVIGVDDSDSAKLKINTGATSPSNGTNAVTVLTSGYVGIGTTAPSYKLDVSGDFRATGLKNQSFVNIVQNGDLEIWSDGTSIVPDGWSKGATAAITRDAANFKSGSYSLKLTSAAGATDNIQQGALHNEKGINYWKGRKLSASVWVKTTISSQVYLYYWDGATWVQSSNHTGSGNWEQLTLTATVNASATTMQVGVWSQTTSGDSYIDGLMVTEGINPLAFAKSPAESLVNALTTIGINKYGVGIGYVNPGTTAKLAINGNVGIGTTDPGSYNLNINGTMSATTIYEGATSLASKYAPLSGSGAYIQLQGSTPGAQQTGHLNISGTGLFGGNVGIGTTGQGAKLEVVQTGDSQKGLWVKSQYGSWVFDDGNALTFYNGSGVSDPRWRFHKDQGGSALSGIGLGGGSGLDTTLYRNSANVLRTGGAMIIDGNVGIGTTSPTSILMIGGAAPRIDVGTGLSGGAAGTLYVNNYTAGMNRPIELNPSAGYIKMPASLQIIGNALSLQYHDGSNYVDGITIKQTSGNVGIGTTSPGAKLDIATPALYTGSTLRLHALNDPSNYYLDINAGSDTGIVRYEFDMKNNGTVYDNVLVLDRGKVGIGTTAPGSRLEAVGIGTTSATSSLNIKNSAGASMLYVRDDGSVGIGTTGPGAGLHVVSDSAKFTGKTGNNTITIEGANASSRGYLNLVGDGATFTLNEFGGSARITYPGELQFGNTSIFDRIVMQSDGDFIVNSGKVGIGTTSPGYKLHVDAGFAVGTRLSASGNNTVLNLGGSGSQLSFNLNGANINIDSDSAIHPVTFMTGTGGGGIAVGYTSISSGTGLAVNGNVGIGTTAPTAKLDVTAGDIALQTTKKIILDSNDTGDTYMAHDSTNDRVSIFVDGIEMVRINK